MLWAKIALNFEHFELWAKHSTAVSWRLPCTYLRKRPGSNAGCRWILWVTYRVAGDAEDSSTMHVVLRGLRDSVLTCFTLLPRLRSFLPQQPCQETVFSRSFLRTKNSWSQKSFQIMERYLVTLRYNLFLGSSTQRFWVNSFVTTQKKVMLITSFT